MTKVAVTGGAGFVGSNLATKLVSQGHEVVIIDDLSTGLRSNVDAKSFLTLGESGRVLTIPLPKPKNR